MARLIDSEVAYRFLTDQLLKVTGKYSEGVNKGLNIARSAMRNPDAIPTIDPESLRPTAHWVKDGDAENPYRGSGTKYHCSACGRRAGYKQRWLYKFCPCCGAKMEDCA